MECDDEQKEREKEQEDGGYDEAFLHELDPVFLPQFEGLNEPEPAVSVRINSIFINMINMKMNTENKLKLKNIISFNKIESK